MAEGADDKFGNVKQVLHFGSKKYSYFDISKCDVVYDELPFCKRVLLESFIRNCKDPDAADGLNLESWKSTECGKSKVRVHPAHVVWQDFAGLPAIIDLAAMRDAVARLGIDPAAVKLKCQVDVILDSSPPFDVSSGALPVVQPSGRDSADQGQRKAIVEASCEEVCPIHCQYIQSETVSNLIRTQQLEFERNKERYQFLKWSASAFDNVRIVPPGSSVLHQFNLEYLANVVFDTDDCLYPESIVGIDSHITMLNGLGVLAIGVSPTEAQAVMVGEPIEMVLPEVVGCRIVNQPPMYVTSTDIVLAITKSLRQARVSGKIVEFLGSGVSHLTILDRTTIANMCPEYGAIAGFFPLDGITINYLEQTGRDSTKVQLIKQYLSAAKMFRNYEDSSQDPKFSEVIEVDLSTITSDCSGPKNQKDRVPVNKLKTDFLWCLENKDSTRGFGKENILSEQKVQLEGGATRSIKHGEVIMASIASCTNSTNSSVMLAAGLLAKKAVEVGLSVKSYVKASVSPGTSIVTHYLNNGQLVQYMQKLGFTVGGYGCPSCISQSCKLSESVVNAVEMGDIVAVGVVSGSRTSEVPYHPELKANYLMSPLLVIAYALAGSVATDFDSEPIGNASDGHAVYLRDIWPTRQEIMECEQKLVVPLLYKEIDLRIKFGSHQWRRLEPCQNSVLFNWFPSSTYITCPPFFDSLGHNETLAQDLSSAHVLLMLGNNISTDFISPAGSISRTSSAGKYLISKRLAPRELNSFGARRGCDAVMARSTFGNQRLENKILKSAGPKTIHFPSGETMEVFDAAERYKKERIPILVIAGSNFGCGSAREWAAKGPWMLGIKAILAESFNESYRSSLVAFGILPLEFLPGQNVAGLKLTGRELYTVSFSSKENIAIHEKIKVQVSSGRSFEVIARLDSEREVAYYKHGGILQYAAHNILRKNPPTDSK